MTYEETKIITLDKSNKQKVFLSSGHWNQTSFFLSSFNVKYIIYLENWRKHMLI